MFTPARLLILVVGSVHTVLTVISWRAFGYAGFFPPFADANTTQIFSDLGISISLVHVAIAHDLRRRGDSPVWNLPLLLGSLLSGSFCPIGYFLWRPALIDRLFASGDD